MLRSYSELLREINGTIYETALKNPKFRRDCFDAMVSVCSCCKEADDWLHEYITKYEERQPSPDAFAGWSSYGGIRIDIDSPYRVHNVFDGDAETKKKAFLRIYVLVSGATCEDDLESASAAIPVIKRFFADFCVNEPKEIRKENGMIWREYTDEKVSAALFDGETKICALYKMNECWHLRPYAFGEFEHILGNKFKTIAEAERAATRYIYDYCTRRINHFFGIRDRLPDF